MLYLNMVDFLTLRGSLGLYLNHVLPPRPSKSCGRGGVGWLKILVTAQRPNPFSFSLIWIRLGLWTLDLALGLSTF